MFVVVSSQYRQNHGLFHSYEVSTICAQDLSHAGNGPNTGSDVVRVAALSAIFQNGGKLCTGLLRMWNSFA